MKKFKIIPRFSPAIKLDDFSVFFKKADVPNIINRFEEQFASFLNRKYAIFTPSGRCALQLILQNLAYQDKRKKVIMPSFTHPSVPLMISKLNLKPIFFDVGRESFLLEVEDSKKYNDCLAVVSANLFGLSADMNKIIKFAQDNTMYLIEDCAQSLGAMYENKLSGSFGHASFYSFSITKNFTTLSGGMLVTDDEGLKSMCQEVIREDKEVVAEIIKAFLFVLFSNPVIFSLFLYPLLLAFRKNDLLETIFKENILLSDGLDNEIKYPSFIKASLGLSQLNVLKEMNDQRRENGQYMSLLLNDFKNHLVYPHPYAKSNPVYLSFPVLVKNRENLKRYLLQKGVDSTIGFLKACHLLDPFREQNFSCPNAEFIEQNILHLPIHHKLSKVDIEYMVGVLKDYFGKYES
ncbi:MAG: aminotransferase class V-fold PLP-dependent enzyme [Candidatus Saelkia tenebricola]|nr:aminotransferase class V-fold PLP-dependent enzyme [Candidatus Saelkia tenebricola]